MYYPIMLDMEGKRAVIFGGGPVAFRKMKNLLRSGARIRLVSPEFIEDFEAYSSRLELVRDSYRVKYLEAVDLVIGATSNRGVNETIARDARELGILANIVDSRELSDFISPSLVDTGTILMAISTKGSYPALSKLIRKDLEERYKKYDEEYIGMLEKIRKEVLVNHSGRKEELLTKALSLNINELKEFYIKLQKCNL